MMNNISAFSEIECIQRMDGESYDMFMEILGQYAPQLELE